MMRVELFAMLHPVAYLNNPDFIDYMIPFTFCPSASVECSIKSYLPQEIDPHSNFDSQLLDLCRYKYNA